MDCNVVGIDWNTDPRFARKMIGANKVFQGNLDPCQLYATTDEVKAATLKMLNSFGGGKHIANLGHGVYPDTPLDSVKTFVNTVKGFSY